MGYRKNVKYISHNPYIGLSKVKWKEHVVRGIGIVTDGGSVVGKLQMVGGSWKDGRGFVKVYKEGWMVIGEMGGAINLLVYIMMDRLEYGMTSFTLDAYEAAEDMDCAVMNVYRWIRRLEDLNVICPKCRGVWWINDGMFYRGTRRTIEKESMRKRRVITGGEFSALKKAALPVEDLSKLEVKIDDMDWGGEGLINENDIPS